MACKRVVFIPKELQEGKDNLGQSVCPPAFDQLRQIFHVVDEDDLKRETTLYNKVEGVVLHSARWPHYPEFIPKMTNLKALVSVGTGEDFLLRLIRERMPCILSRNVAVGNSPGSNAPSTANLAITLLLAAARQLIQGVAYAMGPTPIERFNKGPFVVDVTGQTLGIIGMGRIGHIVAKRAYDFDMKICYHNRNRRAVSDEACVEAVYYAKLEEMLPVCDFVVVACPISPDTHHLISHKQLSLMKPTATIVNVARGKIIDTDSLVEALQNNVIRGAALDVTDPEPLPRDHPLLQLPNVIISAHQAGFTLQSWLRASEMMVENLKASLIDGEKMPYPVTIP